MAQNDINIKVRVDASQAEQQTVNVRKRMKELMDQMTQLQLQGKANTAEYAAAAKELGTLKDAISDTATQARIMSNDLFKTQAAMEGLSVGLNVFSGLSQAAALCGMENTALTETLTKLQAAQNLANVAMNIAKQLNKDTALMTALRTVKEKLLTKSIEQQTKAQIALNAAKKGAIGIVIALTAALAALAIKYISVRKEQDDLNKEISKAGVKALADATVKVKSLDAEYNKLGDDLNAKKKFFQEHKDIMGETAKNVKTIAEADKAWQDQTAGYIQAQKQRAMADAAKEKATEKYKEAFELEDYYTRMQEGRLTLAEKASSYVYEKFGLLGASYASMVAIYKKDIADAESLMKRALEYESEIQGNDGGGDGDDPKKDKWAIRAAIIKNQYLPLIDAANEAGKKTILRKEMEAKLIDNEIDKAKATIKNEQERTLAIYELEKAKKALYDVTVATEDEEVNYMDIVDESTKNQIEDLKQIFEAKKAEQEAWEEFEKEAQEKAEKEREEREKEYLERKQRRQEAYWNAVNNFVVQSNDLLQSLQDAELANAEGNEKQQMAIRRKYARVNFIQKIASIGASTAQAIMGAWASVADIPFPGNVIAGAAQTAMLAATGAAQSITAKKEMDRALSGKAAKGAFVTGRSHAEGGELWELEGGEAVLNKRAMEIPAFRNLASAMNEATGGVSFSTNAMGVGNNYNSALTANVSDEAIAKIVAGVAAIPVVVSENDITTAQRNVSVLYSRSTF